MCRNAAGAALRTDLCNRAPDGELCISFGAPLELRDGGDVSFAPAPFELGALVAFHGGGAQIRYADLGLWRDASLPEPTDCPELAGAKPCGGACGGCPDGTFCHGRSPLHPTGVCQSTDSRTCAFDIPCRDVEGCFVYRVEPEAQREADTLGVCFPVEQCRALAARLPGGGRCDEASTDAGADGS